MSRNSDTGGILFTVGLVVTAVAGWITNIINIVQNPNPLAEWTAYNIIEVIGVFVAPIGVVLGVVSWF